MRGDKSAIVRAAGFPVQDIVDVPLREILRRHKAGNAKLCSDSQAAECVHADLQLLNNEQPDLVLSDFRLSMRAATRIRKIPHVAVLNSTWTPYLDKEQVRLLWTEHTRFGSALGKLSRFLAGPTLMRFRFMDSLFESIFRRVLIYGASPFNKIQTAHGLSPSIDLYHYWLGDLTLVPDYPTFMPLRQDTPDSVKMIGPLVWQGANFAAIENWSRRWTGLARRFTPRLAARVIQDYFN
jgi:UDP:flavonoid glycosyltransferase YjiC (YdhE family)